MNQSTSSSRKVVVAVLGAMLLSGVAFYVGRMTSAQKRISMGCAGVQAGWSEAQLREFFDHTSLKLRVAKDARSAVATDAITFGDYLCEISLADGKVVSATYRDRLPKLQ